jgi:uncharacterized protein YxjI
MKYAYPLNLTFKLLALAPQVSVIDANGKEIFYIKQKMFALKEAVSVYNNSTDKTLQYTIKTDQIIDFGAKYVFRTPEGQVIGAVQQEGMRSLFQASYDVFDRQDQHVFKAAQANPWIALADSLLNMIPFAELLTGFILNPTYAITAKDTQEQLMQMKKKPSIFEAQFAITPSQKEIQSEQETLALLSFLMIVLLERNRG